MITFEIQKNFFNTVISQQNIDNKAIGIYQELIYLRFEDVIKSSFPIFVSVISNEILEKYIKKFVSFGANSPCVWKMPFEFKQFLEQNTSIVSRQYKEILEFESIQIKMYVSNINFRPTKFSWNRSYRLSPNAKIFKSNFNLLNKQDITLKTQYILIYKDINDHDIYYIEITKVMYHFFKYLRNFNSAKQSLKLASKKTNLNYNDVFDTMENTLARFAKNSILI
ncbi:hypothetical protein MNB_ARC-1_562 [hydrothermal vent metagenome]|uniref:Putative DNA-binding domain-containing protein n=1 Tax=hydrothermal vent metagenome TaxID=652676 RepID=A0A3B1DTJ6_9ZZZZ